MNVFVARQPIFDKSRNVFAYELLFRNGLKNEFPEIDGDIATSNVLSNTFFCFALDDLLAGKPGMINFTRELILKKIPLLFNKNSVVVEILETIEPEKEIIDALVEFRQKGLYLALDDFVYHDRFHPMIDLCQIIKFDLKLTPLESLDAILEKIRSRWKVAFLAEKVETYDEFYMAKQKGFDFFQGYFFSKPEIVSKRAIFPNALTKLRLMSEVQSTDIHLDKVEQLIKHDVSISFRLLKFLNSAYFKRPNPINTIKDAVTFLGVEALRKFVCVIVISNLCENKPDELIKKSLGCARMCELCGSIIKTKFRDDELFTLGLFSFLDAILDQPMECILDNIQLSDPLKRALRGEDETFNTIKELYEALDRGMWSSRFFKIFDHSMLNRLPDLYLDAIKMANALVVDCDRNPSNRNRATSI